MIFKQIKLQKSVNVSWKFSTLLVYQNKKYNEFYWLTQTFLQKRRASKWEMKRNQQRSCFQTRISSSCGLWSFLRTIRERLRISFRNTAITPSSVTSCLWIGSCRTLETTGEFQSFMEMLWRSWWIHPFGFCHCSRCIGREYPHNLPTISVVLIYLDEALSVIQRAICSIINRTPAYLLKEIILVDDHSRNGLFLSKPHQNL